MPRQNIPSTLEQLTVPVEGLTPYGGNPRRGNVNAIIDSLEFHGQYRPIVVRYGTNEVLAGNHTLEAVRQLGWPDIAATFVDVDDDTAARIVLVDNRSNDVAGYDEEQLRELLGGLPDLAGTGFDDDFLSQMSREAEEEAGNSSLVERFGAPPFTVLDARQGPWQARKRAWRALGIESEVGRDDDLIYTAAATQYQNWYKVKEAAEAKAGRHLTEAEILEEYAGDLVPMVGLGTSIFDPVLCELMFRWYSPPGGHVLDPWAGGSVRGLVASRLGRKYTGVELRGEQVEANRGQTHLANGPLPAFLAAAPGMEDTEAAGPLNDTPHWIEGESAETLEQLPGGADYDMLIGCPPYYDLETYGDDPRDMSNLTHQEFDAAMVENVKRAAARLKDDAYAVFIVGAVRNKAGRLLDMRSLMVRAGEEAGLTLHNDCILVTSLGTAAFRAARSFTATRVLARTHQDVLIFLKGDRRRAAAKMSTTEVEATLETLEGVEPDGSDS